MPIIHPYRFNKHGANCHNYRVYIVQRIIGAVLTRIVQRCVSIFAIDSKLPSPLTPTNEYNPYDLHCSRSIATAFAMGHKFTDIHMSVESTVSSVCQDKSGNNLPGTCWQACHLRSGSLNPVSSLYLTEKFVCSRRWTSLLVGRTLISIRKAIRIWRDDINPAQNPL